VTLVIDLVRHPEKDYATGNLTEEGKKAFVQKLNEEYTDSGFDTVKCYVSPLKRGQQTMEPLSQFLKENKIDTTIRTKQGLLAKVNQYSTDSDKAMDAILKERTNRDVSYANGKSDALEPVSKDEETLKIEILIREFFDREFPETTLTGEDVGKELDEVVQHLALMARRFSSDSKVKVIAVGHSGIIEFLTKLIYLKNRPDVAPTNVGVEDIGGILDYMSGPKITITSDENGKQKAVFQFKDLSLEYPLASV